MWCDIFGVCVAVMCMVSLAVICMFLCLQCDWHMSCDMLGVCGCDVYGVCGCDMFAVFCCMTAHKDRIFGSL